MQKIIQLLEQKLAQITAVQNQAKKSLRSAPTKGHLRIANRKKGSPQFYLVTKTGDTKGRYLSKKNAALIKACCQRDYDKQVLTRTAKLQQKITALIETARANSVQTIFADSPIRRANITPYILSDKEFAQKWQTAPFKGKPFSNDAPEIYTERGERVRSKSEKIIADKLFSLGIPYRYEAPLHLKLRTGKSITFHPDFTILDVTARREIILEHFGMMDNPDYANHAVEKLSAYAKNGYLLGDNFLITMESSEHPLDARGFERMVQGKLAV